MPSTTTCKTGDVVLVRFPFTDLISRKRRPVLVVSPSDFFLPHGDIVVIPLTSSDQGRRLRLEKWREAGLLKPTWLKPLIATITESLVEKRLGAIHSEDEGKVASALTAMIDATFIGRGYSP